MQKLLKISEVAQLLGMEYHATRKLCENIPVVEIQLYGKKPSIRVRESDLEKFIAAKTIIRSERDGQH